MKTEGIVSQYAIAGIKLCLLTGCRASEAEAMKWADIDIEQKVINLPDSKTGPRSVEMTEEVVEIIESMIRLSNCELVFPGRYGRQIALVKVWWKVRTRASLDNVRLHDLRHSFATTAAMHGVPIPVIARLLGHSTIWTTTRYLHSSRASAAEAAAMVGRTMESWKYVLNERDMRCSEALKFTGQAGCSARYRLTSHHQIIAIEAISPAALRTALV